MQYNNCNTEWDDDVSLNNIVVDRSGTDLATDIELVDPYKLDRVDVKAKYFNDARLYDDDITESGWKINNKQSRSKYRNWLSNVRSDPEWSGFRRAPIEITEEIHTDDGKTFTVKKTVPYRIPGTVYTAPSGSHTTNNTNNSRNKRNTLLPQSRVKGANFDDEDFRAKMFTSTMGKRIAQLRNGLGLNQSDLAKKINVDVATIRNIELGGLIGFNSEDKMVKELAKALEVASIKYQE